jgi:DDE superfamily endonuclease
MSSWPLNPRVKVHYECDKINFGTTGGNLLATVYATANIVHVVLDNLNTHFRKTFVDVLGEEAAAALLERVQFHYTPKHASWLNMAEIEIGIMDRQCTGQRIATADLLQAEVAQWQQRRATPEANRAHMSCPRASS